MKFGYENEYFLRNKDGEILKQIPCTSLPHDGYCALVEVRSDPFENPWQVLASFNERYTALETQVATFGCTLACLAEVPGIDTAGFHIHFSSDRWDKNQLLHKHPHNQPPDDIAEICEILDERFKSYYTGVRRHVHWWRAQPHGWEYRRLPATTDPVFITQVLADEFWQPSEQRLSEQRLKKANKLLQSLKRAA